MSTSKTDVAECTIFLPDERATRGLGETLASGCAPGSVVLLDGPLGAGKTTLVQGFARAIGAKDAASPSFVLAHHYAGGRIPLWHLDLYRIENQSEIDDLDLDQYLPLNGVALVEWASRAENAWPDDRFEVDISLENSARRARVRGFGECASAVRRMLVARELA